MVHTISTQSARIDDAAAMSKFLADIPNSESLGILLHGGKPLSTRAYEDETSAARFVMSDGITALCFSVREVTIDEAEMIAAACLLIDRWDATSFQTAVGQALGTDLEGPR